MNLKMIKSQSAILKEICGESAAKRREKKIFILKENFAIKNLLRTYV